METGSRDLDQPIFKLKLWRKYVELQIFQQLRSMTSAYLGKMCVHFWSCPSYNVMKMLFSYSYLSIIKKVFIWTVILFVIFGGCPYFLNKALHNVHTKKLRNSDPTNWIKYIILFSAIIFFAETLIDLNKWTLI